MIITIEEAKYIKDYRLWLRFNTGENGEIDLEDILRKYPIATSLLDIENFKSFYLDSWPTVAWECGFDLSPETLYEKVTGKELTWLQV